MSRLRAAVLGVSRTHRQPGSSHISARAGDGFVFDQLRTYVDGDEPRRIDWAASARVRTLQTRVFREEEALVLAALVDESGSMKIGRHRALAGAAREALAAWYGLLEPGDRAIRLCDGRAIRQPDAAVRAVSRANIPLVEQFASALALLPLGASLLLITDGLEGVNSEATSRLLRRLAQRHDTTVLLASDPWLAGIELDGLVRLRDSETGQTRRFFIDAGARARYRVASQARDRALRRQFLEAGWRVGSLDEADGARSLARTFGVG